ncbi:MAG: lyase family protein [Candidatus Dojkabacteria bacterium]
MQKEENEITINLMPGMSFPQIVEGKEEQKSQSEHKDTQQKDKDSTKKKKKADKKPNIPKKQQVKQPSTQPDETAYTSPEEDATSPPVPQSVQSEPADQLVPTEVTPKASPTKSKRTGSCTSSQGDAFIKKIIASSKIKHFIKKSETDNQNNHNLKTSTPMKRSPTQQKVSTTQQANSHYSELHAQAVPELFLRVYIDVKKAYACVNHQAGKLKEDKYNLIHNACNTLRAKHSSEFMLHFPVGIIQSGGGTVTNMMINEVIATFAEMASGSTIKIHPNDELNMSQSTNDTFPAVAKITTFQQLTHLLNELEALENLLDAFEQKGADMRKVGRTHLQDALPMTIGDEFSAFNTTVRKNIQAVKAARELCRELQLGATAIGTQEHIDEKLRKLIIKKINEISREKFSRPQNYFEATSSSHDLSTVSSIIKMLGLDLIKMMNDLRLLASGPQTGYSELLLPKIHAGSSIMPGKVNPSILEAMTMICFKTAGNDQTIQMAHMSAQLQLQQFIPIIAFSLFESIDLMTKGIKMLRESCLVGIQPRTDNIQKNLDKSQVYATEYAEKLGYDRVAELIHMYNEDSNIHTSIPMAEQNAPRPSLKEILDEEIRNKNTFTE